MCCHASAPSPARRIQSPPSMELKTTMHRKLYLGLGILLGSFQASTFAQAQNPPRIIQAQPGASTVQPTPTDPAAPPRFSPEDPKPNPGSDPEQPAEPSYGP